MEVIVRLYFPHLKFVSDRTFKESLKYASAIIHQIHISEVKYIIDNSNLTSRQRQSLNDRLAKRLDHIPNYYIESVVRGSFIIEVSFAAVLYFFLQATLGEVVKDSFKLTPMYRWLVKYLSNTLPESPYDDDERKETDDIPMEPLGDGGERWQRLEVDFRSRLGVSAQVGRFQVSSLNFRQGDNHEMIVEVGFELAEELRPLDLEFTQVKYKDIIDQVQQEINTSKDNK